MTGVTPPAPDKAADEPPAAAAEGGQPGRQASLGTVLREWGRIGCTGFGGPPALRCSTVTGQVVAPFDYRTAAKFWGMCASRQGVSWLVAE